MQKVLAIGATTARQQPLSGEGRVVEFPGAAERTGRTFVCSVLFLDIIEYTKKPIGEQLQAKERFNAQVSQAIAEVPVSDRIILDTGDGVAISFLGDPEDALCVALALAPALAANAAVPARIGINLGPVRLTRDINGQPNIVGDGINVAQRVMSFARPGQILVSRGYHEVVARIATDYASLFSYQGSRTDKHVREHEIFELSAPLEQAVDVAQRRKRARRHKLAAAGAKTGGQGRLLGNRLLAYAVTAGSCALLVAALISSFLDDPAPQTAPARATPRTTTPATTTPATTTPAATTPATTAQPRALAAASARSTQPASAAPDNASGSAATAVQPALRPAGQPASPPQGAEPAPVRAPAERSKVATGAKASAGERTVHAAAPVATRTPRDSAVDRPAGTGARKQDQPASAAKANAGPTALVVLAISPWGEVFVDGKSMGVSPPLSELELTPGKHRIVVRNGGFKPLREDVELGSNETIRIKHKFAQPR